jgi:hypothetical protein
LPLQGGLAPVEGLGAAIVEIACDESGFSGTNLLHSSTPVLAHASVDLRIDEAEALMKTLRSGFRVSPNELKSAQLLRGPRSAESREWFLASVTGRAHVQLLDKRFFLVTRVVELFLSEPVSAACVLPTEELRLAARTLCRARGSGGRDWDELLDAALDLLRTKRVRSHDHGGVERLLQARDALAAHGLGASTGSLLDRLTRSRVSRGLATLADEDLAVPPLEPMLVALADTILFWSQGQRQVLVIHDEQSALTARRLRWLQQALTEGAGPAAAGGTGTTAAGPSLSPLAGLVTVDSRDDPRVQVADLLAGLARRAHESGDEDDLLTDGVADVSWGCG